MSAILGFYRGDGRDGTGRTIEEVWAFGRGALETRHDFIQWLFPLREASRYNPAAPLLTDKDEAAFRDEPGLRARLLRSLDLMLGFYGLARRDGAVVPVSDEALARAPWLAPGDHNHLRLSRIVQSLALLGEEDWAMALRARLMAIAAAHPDRVAPQTAAIWARLLDRLG
ncbi:MAG: opioid growth factor receptor-related protein [Alsobacter sp.]